MNLRLLKTFGVIFIWTILVVCPIFAQNSFEVYTQTLQNGTIEEKRNTLYHLRNLSSESASRIASIALKDSSEIIRATATHSILSLNSVEACELLLPLLNEKVAFVRKETAYALGKTRNLKASEPLLKILLKDKDFEVRGAAAFALGLIGDAKAVEFLIVALESKNLFVQRSAARSLGQIGDQRGLSSLETKLLDSKIDDDVRREATWAIVEIKKNISITSAK
jgi:HEAT repeat protein